MPARLSLEPAISELLNAYLTSRSLGKLPWEYGHDVPRRRFAEAVSILAPWFEIVKIVQRCPLIGSE